MSDQIDQIVESTEDKLRVVDEPIKVLKPEKLTRKNSLHKIFDIYLCPDVIFFLPNAVIWLRSTILQKYIEKLIGSFKKMAFMCSLYIMITFKIAYPDYNTVFSDNFDRLQKNILLCKCRILRHYTTVLQILSIISSGRKHLKHIIVVKSIVYLGLLLVYTQFFVTVLYVLNFKSFPVGLIFLLCALSFIVSLQFFFTYSPIRTTSNALQTKSKRPRNLSNKTLSKIKIF